MCQLLTIGHRGAAGHAPENTLTAIRKAIALGIDFVEIDVRRTADGVLVVLHDATVNRTTNGRGRVDRLSLRALKKLEAGNGEAIPTLEEALSVADGRTGLVVELKVKGIAREAVESVHAAGFKNPVIYASFLHEELIHVRAVNPKASLMVLFGRLPRSPVSRAMEYRASHVGLRHDTATRRLVERFHGAEMVVFVYTANTLGDIQRADSIDVDGIISNFPERISRLRYHTGWVPGEA